MASFSIRRPGWTSKREIQRLLQAIRRWTEGTRGRRRTTAPKNGWYRPRGQGDVSFLAPLQPWPVVYFGRLGGACQDDLQAGEVVRKGHCGRTRGNYQAQSNTGD